MQKHLVPAASPRQRSRDKSGGEGERSHVGEPPVSSHSPDCVTMRRLHGARKEVLKESKSIRAK